MAEQKKGWIDPNIVSGKYVRGHNDAKYWVYNDDQKHRWNNIQIHGIGSKLVGKKIQWVCFSDLHDKIKNESSRVQYHMEPGPSEPLLENSEQLAWLKLAKKHGLIPRYVVNEVAHTGLMVIDLKQKVMNPSLLYMYLSTLRYLREEKGFVRAINYMVNDLGIDFWAAFTIGSKVCLNSCGHHVLQLHRDYCATPDVNTQTDIPFSSMRGLYQYIQDPMKYDGRGVHDYNSFNCNSSIEVICKIKTKLTIGQAQHPSIVKAIKANTDAEARKIIKEEVTNEV